MDDKSFALASRSLRDSGVAIIENAYTPEEIATLRDAYEALLAARTESGEVHTTSGQNHVAIELPLVPPFSDANVVGHPAVQRMLSSALGNDFACVHYNSNTALPGSNYQRVHRDTGPVFGIEHGVATPATGIVINIPLIDFTIENGSTEYWPGTHLIVDTADDADVTLDQRIDKLSSARLNVKAGSLVIRDLRVWHRGMPNNSDVRRPMLAIVYLRRWLGRPSENLIVSATTWDSWPAEVQSIFAAAPKEAVA